MHGNHATLIKSATLVLIGTGIFVVAGLLHNITIHNAFHDGPCSVGFARSVAELTSLGRPASSSPSHDLDRRGAIEPHLHTATLDMLLTVCLAGGVGGGLAGSLLGFAPRGAIALTLEAEQYERRRRLADEADDDAHAWRPEDGAERTILTIVGIALFGFAFSSILVGIWTWRGEKVGGAMDGAGGGAIWGLVGFSCLFFSPAYGLPPELPGMAVTSLDDRQLWWSCTVVSTAVAFALLLLVGDGGLDGAPWAPSACRALVVDSAHFNTRRIVRVASALALFVLPHAIGAPHPAESTEFNLPIEIVAEFVARCPVAMVAFYVATGASAGAAFDRYGIHEYQYREDESNLMGEPTARDDAERIWGARCARIFGCGGGKDRSGPGGTKQTTPAV